MLLKKSVKYNTLNLNKTCLHFANNITYIYEIYCSGELLLTTNELEKAEYLFNLLDKQNYIMENIYEKK